MSRGQHIFIYFYKITSQYLNSFTVVFPSKVVAWWNKNLEDATLPIKRRLGWFVQDLHGSCPRPSMHRIFTYIYIYMNGWFFLGAMKLNLPIPWMRHGARCLSSHTSSLILQLGTCTPLEKMLDETSERRSHGITGDYESYLLQLTPSSHIHGSVKNGSRKNQLFPFIWGRVIFHWTMMGVQGYHGSWKW